MLDRFSGGGRGVGRPRCLWLARHESKGQLTCWPRLGQFFVVLGQQLEGFEQRSFKFEADPTLTSRSTLSLDWSFKAENTYLVGKSIAVPTVDLLFDWFGFRSLIKLIISKDLLVWLNPNQLNRRSAVQRKFYLYKALINVVCLQHVPLREQFSYEAIFDDIRTLICYQNTCFL